MNWLDFFILALLIGAFLWSFRQGFIMEVIYFISALGGLLGAFVLYPSLQPTAEIIAGSSQAAATLSFLTLFFLLTLTIIILGLVLHKFIYTIKLGLLDRLLGGLFGLAKVLMLLGVALVMFVGGRDKEPPDYVEDSLIAKPIITTTLRYPKRVPSLFENFHDDYGRRAMKWLRKKRKQLKE